MLAEMTRAFNGGFGLGAHGIAGTPASNNQAGGESAVPPDTNNTVNNQDSQAPSSVTLPPEGSFDRFLMDLQIDLRTALTQAEDLPHIPTHQQSTSSEPIQQPQEAEARTEVANEDRSSMPDLAEVYDTDSDFEDAEESDDDGTPYFYPL